MPDHFDDIFDGANSMFNKEAQFESRLLGLSKKYAGSEIEFDVLDEQASPTEPPSKRVEVEDKKDTAKTGNPTRCSNNQSKKAASAVTMDNCIASGTSIPLNVAKPMAYATSKR